MRILQINKNFYNSGGSDTVFFDTINGLREQGHEVSEFSMQNVQNLNSNYSKYFVSEIPARLVGRHSIGNSWKIFKRLFYSAEVEKKLTQLVQDTRPDVAHIHNAYHHLSVSSFLRLFRLNIPTVLTLHDYFPLCPNHNFLYKESGRKELFQNKFYNCVRYKCINNQLMPSIVATFESYYYRLRKVWGKIDKFICPSNFMKEIMEEGGFSAKKLQVIFNPFKPPTQLLPLGNTIVFLGRIHSEKGVKIFLEAIQSLKDYKVVIAGRGPEDKWVDQFLKEHQLTQVERHSWVQGEKWVEIIKNARVMVFPTIAYENCSRGILEALSYGRLVVASDRGGNKEMIINGKTGFLVKPENAQDLQKIIIQAMKTAPAESAQMAFQGRQLVQDKYSLNTYISSLEEVYKEIIKR
jgi:glycosyltransferase involved in cell wall biosynthesis